ncbi:MAG: family 78 glycoside hydrolase catalytic domain [Bacteroidota bacterium]
MNANKSWIIKTWLILGLIPIIHGCQNLDNSDRMNVTELKCESLINPLGVDVSEPGLSWILESDEKDQFQTAYRILVASSEDKLADDMGDVWDSEKIDAGQSNQIRFEGKKLTSGKDYYWKVKAWDKDDIESDWSEVAMWSTGMLSQSDWKAEWIGLDKAVGDDKTDTEFRQLSARYLRQEFKIEKPVQRATAFICGLGAYELYLNGDKVGDHMLSPGLTDYSKRSLYVTYDVTGNIDQIDNAIGIILGNGRYFAPRIKDPFPTVDYGFPKLLLQINLEYEDGSTDVVISDENWKLTPDGPIIANNEYDGETYDALKEMPGWNRVGFNDSDWMDVEMVESPSKELSPQMTEPIRITETIEPIKITEPQPGVYIFDMGQNMVGWTELTVKGKAGTVVKQRFAESLQDDGLLYLDNIRSAKVTNEYTLKGEGIERFVPRFVFHGFRYVELTGFPGKPDLSTIVGMVIHDDLEKTGDFTCSNPMLNAIYKNAVWGIRGNYRSIPADCPQRDERHGWLGDRGTGSRGESYIYDISNLYKKWLTDVFDSQKPNGSISDVNPAYWEMYNDNVTWDGTPVILVDMLRDQYGDTKVISDSYPFLKKWVDHMINSYLKDDIMPRDSYGDWCMPPKDPKVIHAKDPDLLTDGNLIGTAYFYHILTLMEDFAGFTDKHEEAKYYSELASRMKIAYNKKFLDTTRIEYSNNTATASILSLAFGLVPDEYRQKIFDNLLYKTKIENNSHISTGLIGQQFFNRMLSETGEDDLAFTVNTQEDYPGYGYMINNGATTIWELWNGNTADPAMNSQNHVMLLGDLLIWMYENLAGIKSDPEQPGFKNIIMNPALVSQLSYVKAWHKSRYGMIKSEWEIKGNQFEWKVTIPTNSTATVYVPGVKEPKHVGSGTYTFSSEIDIKIN